MTGSNLSLGGVDFSEVLKGRRGADETTRVAEFEGGLYKFDLSYFDAQRQYGVDAADRWIARR